MTWTNIVQRGSGNDVRYALVIEGWPEIWVTDRSLTLTHGSYGARGRSVRTGLLRRGLEFSERALLAEGKLQASGMRVSIVSADERDHALESFARVGASVGDLGADLETTDTAITFISDASITAGYYHVGTEVISMGIPGGTSATKPITRGHWDTQPQSFYLQDGANLLTHSVYRHPRSAEGRRATIYAWGDGDDPTGYDGEGSGVLPYGQPVWRGIVSVPPQLQDDGVTWSLSLDHIHSVFKQSLAARATEVSLVGIAFNSRAPLYMALRMPAASSYLTRATKHLFFSRDVSDFMGKVQQILDAWLADSTTLLSVNFSSIQILRDSFTGGFYLAATTVGSTVSLLSTPWIEIHSHLTGYMLAGSADKCPWIKVQDGTAIDFITLQASTQYRCDFKLYDWATEAPSDVTQPIFGAPDGGTPPGTFEYRLGVASAATDADVAEWSPQRIWIDRDWSTLSATSAVLMRSGLEPLRGPNTARDYYQTESIPLEIIDSGYDSDYDAYWILVANNHDTGLFHGWGHAETVILPSYAAASSTDVTGLVTGVIDAVEANANDGNLPFIRAVDFDVNTSVIHAIPDITASRNYRFVKAVSLEDVIAEELKLVGYMWSSNTTTGKLTFAPIPLLTGSYPTAATITSNAILTPAGGMGRWPTYEIQAQGLVSVVNIKDGYDAAADEHRGTTYVIADANLLSTHKRRGVTDATIAPKSSSETAMDAEDARSVAARMMAACGREYVTTRVRVPFSYFRIAIGTVVGLTSSHTPNANGTRGVTNKRALVIGRRWNLDMSRDEAGELELLMLLDELAGYCPSGVITSQTGSTTTWTLTLSPANALNLLISPRADGNVASTFAVGDQIRIVEMANPTGTVRSGTVSGVGTNTVSVSLGLSWTPSTITWSLEYAGATTATASQKLYCFVAGEDGRINNAEQTRRFA